MNKKKITNKNYTQSGIINALNSYVWHLLKTLFTRMSIKNNIIKLLWWSFIIKDSNAIKTPFAHMAYKK